MSARQEANLTRQDLFDLVWSKPMIHLADELGLSSSQLVTLCRRHGVPRPPNGYFMMREDRRTMRPKLPKISDPQLETIRIGPRVEAPSIPIPPEILARIQAETRRDRSIKVSAKLTQPHPLVNAARKYLEKQEVSHRSPLVRSGRHHLDVRVAPASISRAMRILDALIKAGKTRGYETKTAEHEGKLTTIMYVEGERIPFRLIEKTLRHERSVSAAEEDELVRSGTLYPNDRYSYAATGRLSLEIDKHSRTNVQTRWQDGARHRLEERLNDFFISTLRLAAEAKADRVRREQERLTRERLARERAESQRLLEDERERVGELLKQVDAWHLADRIRAFVRAAQGCGATEKWTRWALEQADRVDPCMASRPSILTGEDD